MVEYFEEEKYFDCLEKKQNIMNNIIKENIHL